MTYRRSYFGRRGHRLPQHVRMEGQNVIATVSPRIPHAAEYFFLAGDTVRHAPSFSRTAP